MNILIPMAGAGKRFDEAGYTEHKPAIPTTSHHTGEMLPMVVCATEDLPGVAPGGANVIYIDRTFHKRDGVEDVIRAHYPAVRFITIDHLTEGQACTCLLAKDLIDNDEELLIAGCDNGMIFDEEAFEKAKKDADMLVFTYRNNECVLENPNAYGWVLTDAYGAITGLSIKQAVSGDPMHDHAVVATFWFRSGRTFVQAAEAMIAANDRVNKEFYVDVVPRYVMAQGGRAKVFEIGRYIGWGTPEDYENYQKTWEYWEAFYNSQDYLGE